MSGQGSAEGHANPKIALPALASASGRPRPGAPMSCKICRRRKMKCSRTLPMCESCRQSGKECEYDSVPRKRVPYSAMMRDLYKRMEGLEKKWTDPNAPAGVQAGSSQGAGSNDFISAESPGALSDINTSLSPITASPQNQSHAIAEDRQFIVDVFFREVDNNPYSFVHESTVRQNIVEKSTSHAFFHAFCAISSWYMINEDADTRRSRCEYYTTLSRDQLDVDEHSLENLQTLILQSLSYLVLGQGRRCWMRLGAAIRMAFALEFHREPFASDMSIVEKESARRCFFTCYLMDRFSVCGSRRPMLITDEALLLRLPDTDNAISQNVDSNSCFFQELPNRQIGQEQPGDLVFMITDITRILGKANNYLQRGGLRGDSHFPWHPMSNLSGMVNELKNWELRISSIKLESLDLRNRKGLGRWFLSWFIYHLIYVRIYRPFLPVAMSSSGFESVSGNHTWQAEATASCLKHASCIAELAVSATKYNAALQPFVSYCLASAATVLIHATHYHNETTSAVQAQLVQILNILLQMRPFFTFTEHQCALIRKIHIKHAALVKQYYSGNLDLSRMLLDDFFERYQEPNLEQCHIPFSELGNWMDPSFDGPDDIFASEKLAPIIATLRGISYTKINLESQFQADELQLSPRLASPLDINISQIPAGAAPFSLPSSGLHDGYFDYEDPILPNNSQLAFQFEGANEIEDPLLLMLQEMAESEPNDQFMLH